MLTLSQRSERWIPMLFIRMFLVYNEETGRFQTGRQYPTLILVSLSSVDETKVKLEAVGMPSVIFEVPNSSENASEAVQCTMWWGEPVKCIDCGTEPAEWLSRSPLVSFYSTNCILILFPPSSLFFFLMSIFEIIGLYNPTISSFGINKNESRFLIFGEYFLKNCFIQISVYIHLYIAVYLLRKGKMIDWRKYKIVGYLKNM